MSPLILVCSKTPLLCCRQLEAIVTNLGIGLLALFLFLFVCRSVGFTLLLCILTSVSTSRSLYFFPSFSLRLLCARVPGVCARFREQLEGAMKPSQHAALVCSVEPPYSIAHVNAAWTALMGHSLEDVKSFPSSLMNVSGTPLENCCNFVIVASSMQVLLCSYYCLSSIAVAFAAFV